MTDLTNADRKVLMELLGECDHRWNIPVLQGEWYTCILCGAIAEHPHDRTLTTGNDMVALKEKLVGTGKWEEFWNHYYQEYMRERRCTGNSTIFSAWFMHPPRFCKLVAEWWREN